MGLGFGLQLFLWYSIGWFFYNLGIDYFSKTKWGVTDLYFIIIIFRIIISVSLQISQISCLDANKAPSGCTQYFYGSTTGTISSFNYANSYQLANQRQTICIRYFINLNNENTIELVLQMLLQPNNLLVNFQFFVLKLYLFVGFSRKGRWCL